MIIIGFLKNLIKNILDKFFSAVSTLTGLILIERFSRRGVFILISSINIACLFGFVIFAQLEAYEMSSYGRYGCIVAIFGHGITYR